MKRLKIAVTSDYDSLVPMFIENRLEFGMDEPVPTDLVKCWSVTDDDGKIQGGAVLAMRQGEYICDGIAVNPEYRKANIGSELLSLMVDEIRKRGGKVFSLWQERRDSLRAADFRRLPGTVPPYSLSASDVPSMEPNVIRRL